jgi:hypothetical protein
MGWFSSTDVTRFAARGMQFSGAAAPDGRFYYDLPPGIAAEAVAQGLQPSGAPPAAAPALDRAALVSDVAAEVERRLAGILGADAAPAEAGALAAPPARPTPPSA